MAPGQFPVTRKSHLYSSNLGSRHHDVLWRMSHFYQPMITLNQSNVRQSLGWAWFEGSSIVVRMTRFVWNCTGAGFEDLRRRKISSWPHGIVSQAALSVVWQWEKHFWKMNAVLDFTAQLLPENKPHDWWVWERPDGVDGGYCGVDMFDCDSASSLSLVIGLMTSQGRLVVKNTQFAEDFTPAGATHVRTTHARLPSSTQADRAFRYPLTSYTISTSCSSKQVT